MQDSIADRRQAEYEQVKLSEGLPVLFKIVTRYSEFISNHWHEDLEVIFIVQGHMEVRLVDSVIQLYDQDFIIINSGDIHSTSCPNPCTMFLLQLPLNFLVQNIPDYSTIRFENPGLAGSGAKPGLRGNELTDSLRQDLYSMGMHYKQHEPGYQLDFQSNLFHFLSLLNRYARVTISPSERLKSDKNREQLSKVTSYVSRNYRNNISLPKAASLAGLQPEYFCRFFKRNMGMTFMDYVNQVRFSFVYEDLINTDYSINSILEKHGFTNYKLFMKLFKEKYNCTPAVKRKSILP